MPVIFSFLLPAAMSSTLQILFPVFGLILAGFVCRRINLLGPTSASELNRFVVWLALPALLFYTVARTTWAELYQPGFAAAFGLGLAAVFGVVLIWRRCQGVPLVDASIDAMAAAYPNVGYMGFPMGILVFGAPSMLATTIAMLLVACVLFAVSIVCIETGLQTERRPHRLAGKVLAALARNPLIIAPIAGALMMATETPLPAGVDTFMALLAGAASPCALVSLGLFLADKRPAVQAGPTAIWLTVVKMVAQPALTWWLAARVFELPADMVGMAVLLAALPTGTGPYMLAQHYARPAQVTARVILLSTVGALATLTLLLAVLI